MAFCPQCGSEVKGDEAYCAVCGIALHNLVLEGLSQEEETDAEETGSSPVSQEAQASGAPETGAAPEESGTGESTETQAAEAGDAETADEASELEEAVPEDEFVDISALRGDDEEAEPEIAEPGAAGDIPSEEAVDASKPQADENAAEEPTAEQEIPEDEFVDISALKGEEQPTEPAKQTEPAEKEEVPQPPVPEVLGGGESGTGAASGLSPEEDATRTEEPEEEASTVVKPADEIIQTPLPSDAEKPEKEETVASRAEDEDEVAGSEPAPVTSAESEEQEVETPAEPESEPEAAEDFLEDKTLIAMPIPDLSTASGSEVSKPAESPEESREDIGEAEAAPSPEDPVEEQVEHHLDGEDTLDEGDQAVPAEEEAAEASPEPESSEPIHTAPNIGKGDTAGGNGPKLQPLTEGTVLNARYEIVRKIGGGGMGAVYLASDKNLGGVLRAVKEMVQSYIEEDQQEKAVADFKRESMLLTSLEHPAIPTIYDYFFDEGAHRFYLVMKYISGGDLAARLRSAPDGKLDEKEVAEWGMQIADVLDYLHNRQPPIVYRDLKPANIMLDGNTGKVMLIDFGIARWINKEEKGVTAVGTMGYAPPELFSGNVVPSSDIYSLGSTMFHLLTGADPQNNPLLIFDFEKHPRPRQINPRLSDQIESILMRAVEYNAEKRFSDAAGMRDALADHLTNLEAGNVTYGVSESPAAVGFSDQTVFCGFCGQKIVATDMFCAFCGAKQPLAQPGVQSQEYIPVKLTAKLLIEGTSQLDYPSFDLAKEENLVGRRDPMSNIFPEVDLSKFDPQTKISRKHARIFRDGESFMLEDLGSSNGTLLIPASQEPVRLTPHQAQALTHGDRIKLGDTMLHFVVSA